MNDQETTNNEIIQDNLEFLDDIKASYSGLITGPRDWTVETILSQVTKGNIDLNPTFQRRNVWNDQKRSSLIESLLLGSPVPQLVLAEDNQKKSSFIVIDGKQRLLTLAGFMNPAETSSWDKPILKDLPILTYLNGSSAEDMQAKFGQEYTELLNSTIRTVYITNYKNDDVLYDIFMRLNTGSVPLSTQELRQALNKGPFSNYLIEITNTKQPIHSVLNIEGPDKRLRDVEIILRQISFEFFSNRYRGNLKTFLDESMTDLNKDWENYEGRVKKFYADFNKSILRLKTIFKSYEKIGRKYTGNKYESRFNKVLFEVEVFYFMKISDSKMKAARINAFIKELQALFKNNQFVRTVESTTKTIDNYSIRYRLFHKLISKAFDANTDTVKFR